MNIRIFYKSYRKRYILLVVVLVFFLSTLSMWLTPTKEQWFPKHMLKKARNGGIFVQRFPFTRTNLNRTLRILFWTPCYYDPTWGLGDFSASFFSSCPVSDCFFTNNKSDISVSDALIFSALDLWYYFIGYSMPEYKRLDQVWILVNQEPPPHLPTDFKAYNNLFNWTASYKRESDLVMPHFITKKLTKRMSIDVNMAATKSAGIAWVASNCWDDARRQMLVREIHKYFPVDMYGSCGNRSLSNSDMFTVLKKYKFYLAFENSYCRDYTTEKLSGSFQRRNIPVVNGNADYKSLAPPHSYIDVRDFNSVEDLAEYLKYLDRNDTAYNSYFGWIKDYTTSIQWNDSFWCRLCEALHDDKRPSQVYTDLAGYIEDDTCHRWTLPRYIYRIIQGAAMEFGLV